MPNFCEFCLLTSNEIMHRFPNPAKYPERFRAWVSFVGGKLETDSDFRYYKNKRICDVHFTDGDRNRYNRLNALAVPSLQLPATSTLPAICDKASTFAENLPQRNLTTTATSTLHCEPESTSAENLPQTNLATTATSTLHCEPESTSAENLPQTNLATTATSTLHCEPESTSAENLPQTNLTTKETSQSTTVLNLVALDHNYAADQFKRKTGKYKSMERPLCTQIKQLRSEISRLRKRSQSYKARLRSVENLSNSALLQNFNKNLARPAQLFLQMQLEGSKKPKGRRFTIEEKVLSLSIYKKSPKCYALLYNYFTLPSPKAMKRLLSTIKLSPGINPIVFNKIKKTVLEKPVSDRLCSLMFDEMSLTPHVNYNAQKDVFEGFATNHTKVFADHALVFMVKGIKKNFKQPIAYYFTSCLKRIELKNLIKTVIKHAQNAGLIIINTVCDQSSVNVGAITDLVNETKSRYLRLEKEWRHDLITINGHSIIPIYDAPHLIKGIRNNLLTKDMAYTMQNEEKVVKWEYFQKVYAADKSHGELRLLHKITEEHVNPTKIKKMRVKSATQLFSHSVAVVTDHLTARGDLEEECRQLIDITLLLDNVFDSLNISSLQIPNGKIYKGPVKRHSPHHELWRKAKIILKTIKFRQIKIAGDKVRLIETTVPSVSNLIKTIEGMEAIWQILSQKYGFEAFLTRNLNQDPVENFFGNIRSYGARNNAPNTMGFESAFKALLLNNYSSPHSIGANCESDHNKCLQTLDFFLTERLDTPGVPSDTDTVILCNDDLFTCADYEEGDAGQRNYVCGWVLTKCLKNIVKSCKNCRQDLIDHNENPANTYIRAKEYNNKKWLCYPSKRLENCFHDLQKLITSFLKTNMSKKNLKINIMMLANTLVDCPTSCNKHQHELKEYFMITTINLILCSWSRSINRILSGKIEYNGDDETKISAQQYYNKTKHFKNKKK